ncbi:MAG TPA: cation:proton antiporter [Gammaproteobacteria bacterium]|nr:cation:proton antiporter [Gammaproteobacteria bacterium]
MESATSLTAAKHVLLLAGVVLGSGAVCGYIAQRTRIPDIVLYLLAGIVLGPAVSGLVSLPANSTLGQLILIFGASYILFDGGASLRLSVLKEIWITLTAIATVGVLVTALITAVAAHHLLGLSWLSALLLGSVIASTDPATLVPVFKQVRVRERLAQAVTSESAFNDAMGAILTFTILGIAVGTREFSPLTSFESLLLQAGIGIGSGLVLGYLAAFLIGHHRYGFFREYAPLVTLMAVAGAYLGADDMHASGFMAVFVAGIIIGNRELFGFRLEPGETRRLLEYVDITSLVMRVFIFILLGMQVNFSLIGAHLWGSLGVVLVFMLLARPVTVLLCAAPDRRARWSWRELLFMCWTRETGVIPGALAGLLIGGGAPAADIIAGVTFVAILVTILVQATTTRWLATRLDLMQE